MTKRGGERQRQRQRESERERERAERPRKGVIEKESMTKIK